MTFGPEAQALLDAHKIRILAILEQPGWTVRILTKNTAVADDFDVIQRYRDRVQVALSITGTPEARRVLPTS